MYDKKSSIYVIVHHHRYCLIASTSARYLFTERINLISIASKMHYPVKVYLEDLSFYGSSSLQTSSSQSLKIFSAKYVSYPEKSKPFTTTVIPPLIVYSQGCKLVSSRILDTSILNQHKYARARTTLHTYASCVCVRKILNLGWSHKVG